METAMKEVIMGIYECRWCKSRLVVEVEPSYGQEGWPVPVAGGWGAIPMAKQHECSEDRYGVAELVGWRPKRDDE